MAQAEEEAYTAGIIDHFTRGLLKLPEGTTLRAYLAEKLNCDPMRITKKFTGEFYFSHLVFFCELEAPLPKTAGP